ncbi:hypothetical protein KIH31_13015 [Paenarthrobacter sp. DKR-5]|uniref:hypothetical protein n=1 Tax=Paenarthrobacter sp. DKR-5 TaxID=2835535 RepID=UPI001BDC889E|nr:hypothetical protein [Paenarthrobacter sp. DKR-5]MBT1003525.1 hypothetical protein [Paenarthrobacter sp. DKR-5]
MGEFRLYTDEEKASYVAPSCELCGQHRHIRWTEAEKPEGGAHWLPRDAGCSNEACPDFR